MAAIARFEDIDAWKLARALTVKIYRFAKDGNFSRDYGFRDQICRAAVSIVSNIAEGFERNSRKSFQQFLAIAKGSAGEVRAQLYIALDLNYLSQAQFDDAFNDVCRISRMLSRLIDYLSGDAPANTQPSTLQPSTFNDKGY
jgi:four helix bundle protein